MTLIAYHESAEVPQPREEPFYFPPPSVPAKRAAILRLGTSPIAAIGRDHLDAQLVQSSIQGISTVAAVPDQSLRQFALPNDNMFDHL
jgi:hypothetical protein